MIRCRFGLHHWRSLHPVASTKRGMRVLPFPMIWRECRRCGKLGTLK